MPASAELTSCPYHEVGYRTHQPRLIIIEERDEAAQVQELDLQEVLDLQIALHLVAVQLNGHPPLLHVDVGGHELQHLRAVQPCPEPPTTLVMGVIGRTLSHRSQGRRHPQHACRQARLRVLTVFVLQPQLHIQGSLVDRPCECAVRCCGVCVECVNCTRRYMIRCLRYVLCHTQ